MGVNVTEYNASCSRTLDACWMEAQRRMSLDTFLIYHNPSRGSSVLQMVWKVCWASFHPLPLRISVCGWTAAGGRCHRSCAVMETLQYCKISNLFFCALNAKTRIPVALSRAGLLDLVPFLARRSLKSERFRSDRGVLSLQIEHIAQ